MSDANAKLLAAIQEGESVLDVFLAQRRREFQELVMAMQPSADQSTPLKDEEIASPPYCDESVREGRLCPSVGRALCQCAIRLQIGKFRATAGVDIALIGGTPSGKRSWVDVCFDDDVSLADVTLADLFGHILPLQKGSGQFVPVSEHGPQHIVVRFEIPGDANSLNACW